MKKRLILVRGVPGAGKTTFAKSLGDKHVEADMFHMIDGEYKFDITKLVDGHVWCRTIVEGWMSDSEPLIIVSNTFTTENEMEGYYETASFWGYQVTSIIVENRHSGESIHNVPDEIIEKMVNRFQIKLK
jgi:hypothetical protein